MEFVRHFIVLYTVSSALIFTLLSCEKNEPIGNDTVTISYTEEILEGARGSEISIDLMATSSHGISRIIATLPSGEIDDVSLVAGSNDVLTSYAYSIPGDALLGENFEIIFTATDAINAMSSTTATVKTIPILTSNPDQYTYIRNNQSSVSHTGQTVRMDMADAILAYISEGDESQQLLSSILHDAFANVGGNGNGFFTSSSTKQLRNKAFIIDLDEQFFETLFDKVAEASMASLPAENGSSGLLNLEDQDKKVLVDEKGHVLGVITEMGLMGSVMINQIYNTYLTDTRTGDDIENTTLRDSENFTDLEHHWDEAFGYWGAPINFSSSWPIESISETRYWSTLTNQVDPILGLNDILMEAFKTGRTAIVNNDLATKNTQRNIIQEKLETMVVANAIHYINESIKQKQHGNPGECLYAISMAWGLVQTLSYIPTRKIDIHNIEEIKNSDFGLNGNFWDATEAGLLKAKNTLINFYPKLENVKNDL